MPTSYHMVHYLRFERSGEPEPDAETFEQLCRRALSTTTTEGESSLWERVQDRFYTVEDDEGKQILLNRVADLTSAVFGEMCLIQNKGLQALLEMKASKVQLSNVTFAEVFALAERSAPEGSHFVRGMVYWLAIGGHLFFLRLQSMNTELIKKYFDWLLRVRTNAVPNTFSFDLKYEFDKSQVPKDIGDVQKLRLSGKSAPGIVLRPPPEEADDKQVKTTRRVAERTYVFQQAQEVVEVIFGKAKTEALVDSLGPDEYLAVDASVKVRGTRTQQSRDKFKQLAGELADLTEAKIQVEGKDGKMADGDAILRTRMPFEIAVEASNFLEFDNVADQLMEVYTRYVKDKKIEIE